MILVVNIREKTVRYMNNTASGEQVKGTCTVKVTNSWNSKEIKPEYKISDLHKYWK